jgi:Xaa-Pro aminopeptidase
MAWKIPDEFVANRYGPAHGIGLADEYPDLPDAMDWERSGYDGVLEANMTFCIESYIGAVGGAEGVKLEQQVLVTADGPQVLSSFPFEDALLA